MPNLDGVDVSEYQGVINWPAVPDLFFVACKASQYFKDPQFDANWLGMRARNFPVRPAYHFITEEDPNVQAYRFFEIVNAHGPLQPGEVPALDVEGNPLPVEHVCAVRDAIEHLFGRPLLPYIGHSYPGAARIIGNRPWWLPSYGISDFGVAQQAAEVGANFTVWQWGGGGEGAYVAGITPGERVDSNQVQDHIALRNWANSDDNPTKKEDDEMASLLVLDPDDGVTVWELSGLQRRHVDDPDELNLLTFLGNKYLDATVDADARRLWLRMRTPVLTVADVTNAVHAAIGNLPPATSTTVDPAQLSADVIAALGHKLSA